MRTKNQECSFYTCPHENDACKMVILAAPPLAAIQECNRNWHKCLYAQPVNVATLKTQYEALLAALRAHGAVDMAASAGLSSILSIMSSEDLGNLVFTRDPILCTPKGIVLGRFKEPVREKELEIWRIFLSVHDIPILASIEDPHSIVEGGDFIPAGDRCFVATGNRTNLCGVHEMMARDLFGTDTISLITYPPDGNMATIHLDCYFGLVGKKHVVLWEEAARFLTVREFRRKRNHASPYRETKASDMPIVPYLESIGLEVILVPTASQRSYGCNLLDLGNNTVLVQDAFVAAQLQQRGYHAILIPFGEYHKMYGGIRCATQVLLRRSPS